ncbi:GntR family transcriptional regulator [Sphingomonas sp.]|uniref:GntR family transcriptional regulator n=1 Tax=Sphingomonas sp. TaxID=28214 RepID=UPI0025FAF208|nr:GntR family transcriptional regulator [Sphingomonas sp.]
MEHLLHLDHNTARPLYLQLEEQLIELIESGQLAVGDSLPPERKLAEALGISRSTVQQSYAILRERQLLAGQGRQGSIIQNEAARLRPGMDRLRGFTEELEKLGRRPSVRVLECRIVEDRSVASLFGLPSTAKFLRLVRVRLGDDVPLSRESAWYSLEAAPFLADADPTQSIYGQLAAKGLPPASCDQTVEATMPNQEEAEIFGFEQPFPCLLIKRKTHALSGVMLEYVEGTFRGDAYVYRLKLDA